MDLLNVAHPSHKPRQLRRYGATSWAVNTLQYTDLQDGQITLDNESKPWGEIPFEPQTTVTFGATSGSTTATASANAFTVFDYGCYIEVTGGKRARIVGYTSATVVSVLVDSSRGNLPTTVFAAGSWKVYGRGVIGGAPSLTPSIVSGAIGVIGTNVSLTASFAAWEFGTTLVKYWAEQPSTPANAVGHITVMFSINGGLIEIDSIASATSASGRIVRPLENLNTVHAGGYGRFFPMWTAGKGYPGAVGIYEQRTVWAASTSYPLTLWGSGINSAGDLIIGSADDEPYEFDLNAEQAHAIQHLPSIRDLLPLTYGSEWSIGGADNFALTASNVRAKQQTAYGANDARPVRVGNEVIYIQRGGLKVRSLGYRWESDTYDAPEVSLLSEHITEGGIVEMSYAQDPDRLVWMVRGDGKLVAMAIDRAQDVTAFSKCETDGSFESVATIPDDDVDQTWFVVNRTINGGTERYVEYLDPDLQLDCAIVGTSGSAQTVWSGLSHLEGETVAIIGDGVYQGTKVVSSGSVTIDTAALEVQIGLPFTVTVQTLTPEASPGISGTQAMPTRVSKVWLRVYESTGDIVVNGQTVTIATPPTLFSGDVDITNLGWADGDGSVTITQSQPYPLTILAVVKQLTVNQP